MTSEQVYQLCILFQFLTDFIIEFIEIPDIIRVCAFLEAVVAFEDIGRCLYLTELIDVVLVRISQPQVCRDGILILIMLSGSVSVLFE